MFNFFSELKTKYLNVKQKISPFQIVMVGDYLMYIEGKLSLMTLSKENIVFKVEGGVIVVRGTDLSLKEISDNTTTISGKICSWEKV